MEEIESLWFVPYLTEYKALTLFLGAFFFGETVILSAVFLGMSGAWSLLDVFLYGLLGTFAADMAWFVFGRRFLGRTRRWQRLKEKHKNFFAQIDRKDSRHQLWYLIVFKFFYGSRIATILYVATHKMAWWRFALFDTMGNIVWLTALITVGWAAWSGFTYALDAFRGVAYLLTAILLLVIIVKLLSKWLSNRYNAPS
jgi:membrane protein DedA with SNARE-associated domain